MAGLVGRKLGRYEIVAVIGAGGMGTSSRARHRTRTIVAVKVITDRAADIPRALDRFEREAKTVAQLSHPNILDIFDFGREEEVVYAVTELLEGRDLRVESRGQAAAFEDARNRHRRRQRFARRRTAKGSSTGTSSPKTCS